MSSRINQFTMAVSGSGYAVNFITVQGRGSKGRVRRLEGEALRIYRKACDDEMTALMWMRRVESLAELLLQSSMDIRIESALTGAADSSSFSGTRRVSRFAAIELKTRRVTPIFPLPTSDVDEIVRFWESKASLEELLVEVTATSEHLTGLLRQFVGTTPSAHDPAATEPGDVRGKVPQEPRLPFDTPESASLRSELSRDWFDAEEVSKILGSEAGNRSHLPNRLRREGKILGVWVLPDHRYRFPRWQFVNGRPIEQLAEVLSLLRGENGVARGRRTSGWEEIEWLCRPHALLEGHKPCDVLASDPQRVLEVATQEFTEDPDARW